jgi:hypothetical protein
MVIGWAPWWEIRSLHQHGFTAFGNEFVDQLEILLS